MLYLYAFLYLCSVILVVWQRIWESWVKIKEFNVFFCDLNYFIHQHAFLNRATKKDSWLLINLLNTKWMRFKKKNWRKLLENLPRAAWSNSKKRHAVRLCHMFNSRHYIKLYMWIDICLFMYMRTDYFHYIIWMLDRNVARTIGVSQGDWLFSIVMDKIVG